MATSESIRDCLSKLFDVITEASATAKTFTDLAGEQAGSPVWPFVFECNVERIAAAAEELERLVRRDALPRLEDMETVLAGGRG